MKICPGCQEVSTDKDLCDRCQKYEKRSKEFYRLEDEEGKIGDEICELESELWSARERMMQIQEKLNVARRRYQENDMKMTNFDWSVDGEDLGK